MAIFCLWNTARKMAGLADVRMHDLRHSFASLLINSGRTLYDVHRLLGHTQVKTTQRPLAPESGHAARGCQGGDEGSWWSHVAGCVGSACGFTGLVGYFDITLPQRSPSQRNC